MAPESLPPALRGMHTAFYLVHSMGAGREFEEMDRRAAENFRRAAESSGLRHIVYLGGLGAPSADLSAHLRSRHEVGEILRASRIRVTELRASIVLGAGSLSFEMIRALAERLPIMVTPRWVDVQAQPIAIDDLLAYLMEALEDPGSDSFVAEIGGTDQVSYGDLMREYARQRGLHRWMIRVPFLTPRLSSLWLGLVTPLYARVGRTLIESIRHPTVVRDDTALRRFRVRPVGVREAISRALEEERHAMVETSWFDALSSGGEAHDPTSERFGNRIVDSRAVAVSVPSSEAFAPIARIGGDTGWYSYDLLWRFRGFMDLLVGGVGVRRGRRSPDRLRVGDALDFWRVEAWEPPHRLRLRAEMKVPGKAWLEFEVRGHEGGSTIRQTAIFDPRGLSGLLYWYALLPIHQLIFRTMLRRIARLAEGAPTGSAS